MNIERARPDDFSAVRTLLERNSLPTDDLTPRSLELFRVARDATGVVGAVGLERHGNYALLRSLVVDAEHRDRGLGSQLVASAEALATQLGLRTIYLLTTTAADFFAARGFRAVPRDSTPDEIKRTSEFASLCPSTAVVMTKEV